MMAKKSARLRRTISGHGDDLDPMNVVGNLFDVAMVFSVALMVALISYLDVADMLFSDSFTMVKNPGTTEMQIITKNKGKIERYTADSNPQGSTSNKGKRVGSAYQLDNGEIVYLPE